MPLKLFGGSGNYATALFIAATKTNTLDKVEAEILDVVEASKRSPRFSKFIKDLSIPRKTRVKTVTEIFSEVGFCDVTRNFLSIVLFISCFMNTFVYQLLMSVLPLVYYVIYTLQHVYTAISLLCILFHCFFGARICILVHGSRKMSILPLVYYVIYTLQHVCTAISLLYILLHCIFGALICFLVHGRYIRSLFTTYVIHSHFRRL